MAKRLTASALGAILGTIFSLVVLAPTAHAQQTANAPQAPAPATRNQSAAPAAPWNSLSIPPKGSQRLPVQRLGATSAESGMLSGRGFSRMG